MIIIVDYLQLMTSKESNIRHLKVGSFTHELRKLANDFNVCVIVSSQLSRSVEIRGGDKRPQLADLKDSGAIEQDTDKVIFLYRPEYYKITINEDGLDTTGILELIMAKNRNGNLGTVRLKRNANATRLKDYGDNLNNLTFISGDHIINEAEHQINVKGNAPSILSLTSETLAILNNRKRDENLVKTGFKEYDNLFGGLLLGELVVVGGRPSMGITQLLINLTLNVSIKTPVLYFTLDLSTPVLTNRFISSITNIDVSKLLHPDLTSREKKIVNRVGVNLRAHQIYISESQNHSLSDLRSFCENQINERGVKIIIVDYLQLMNSKEPNIRHLKVGSFTHELRKIAVDFNVCVIVASQLSRSVEIRGGDKRPQLSDLKDSSAIEQDADKVIFLYRPEYYRIMINEDGMDTTGILELIMAKNRNGNLGTVKLKRNSNATRLKNYGDNLSNFDFNIWRQNEN